MQVQYREEMANHSDPESCIKLVIAARCAAEELYTAGTHASEFARTVSRLLEMRSHEYLVSGHRRYETHTDQGCRTPVPA